MIIRGKEINCKPLVCPKCKGTNIQFVEGVLKYSFICEDCKTELKLTNQLESLLDFFPEQKKEYLEDIERIKSLDKIIRDRNDIRDRQREILEKLDADISKIVEGRCFCGCNRYYKALKITTSRNRYEEYEMYCLIIYSGQKPSDNNVISYGYITSSYLAAHCREVSETEFDTAMKECFVKIKNRSDKAKKRRV